MKKVLLFLAMFFATFPVWAQEAESIQSFHAAIVIDRSGLITITEHIKVYAAGDQIKKGIFRTIPVYRQDIYGHKKRIDITVKEVTKNGQQEPFVTMEEGENTKIRIGDADVDLEPGVYEYTIQYETMGHIGFFEDFDELYWNVTGNDWNLPIIKASASVELPDGASIKRTACYTGPSGSKETNCSVQDTHFSCNRELNPGDGFTIAVAFPIGFIKRPPPPSFGERVLDFLNNFKEIPLLAILFGFFYYTWRKYGMDPVKPVVVPTFEPPDGLSPAAIAYLYTRQSGNKSFTAALVHMAVKKVIRIKEDSGDYVIEKGPTTPTVLPKEEQDIYEELLRNKERINVDDKNHAKFSAARRAFNSSIVSQFDIKSYYRPNIKLMLYGGLMLLGVLLLYLLLTNGTEALPILFMVPFLAAGSGLFFAGLRMLKDGCGAYAFLLGGGLFLIIPLIALGHFLKGFSILSLVFLGLIIVGYVVYIYLIKAPTPLGAEKSAAIEGFKMYLETAEEQRLDMLTPPERTPELFERLLPYAIALELENAWGDKFKDVLEQANYSPEWYSGEPLNYNRFPNHFVSSVSAAQIDPTPPASSSSGSSSSSSGSSSWSSGSSSSGSSGGGGGGGGGGGW
ncbi:DUF2207 domain-containing protein [Chitinophaga sp. SYP-B3965]|uniref:DUF2207 domain-containing protein n=1 Tax=Chitinophaga sp. SYP-B3965 TaxID=2663120 RepID=UPI00129A003B|nr:DUF2207 domain-containing protein [Chitinophaga sp. SYP-B3965]MRG44693.1 DUF2207 domain-containing protein [Chitinophaga sp. SYP-B3965]